jgi:DNA-binding MarR family transcriptional regulator
MKPVVPEKTGTPGQSIPEKIGTALAKISLAMKSHAWRQSSPRGLNPTQAQILSMLFTKGLSGGMRLGQVARELGITSATASDSVRSLETKGFVSRQSDPVDARAIHVTLTPGGSEEAGHTMDWPELFGGSLHTLTDDEQAAFLVALIKMIRVLQEQNHVPISRMCVTCTYFKANAHPAGMKPHHCHLVNAPLGVRDLRIECPEQIPAAKDAAEAAWLGFLEANRVAAQQSEAEIRDMPDAG